MKKSIFTLAASLLMMFPVIAQNTYNVVIFSEDGEPFFAFVNGIRQNDKPETNIRVTHLNSEMLNLRVEFPNKALPQLKQNMMPEFGFEHTVKLKQNTKKVMKMQYFGKVPLEQSPKDNASTVQFHTQENPVQTGTSGSGGPAGNNPHVNSGTGGNGTIVTGETTTQVNPDAVSISVNMGGVGMNVNVNGMDRNTTYTSSSSTTITSSGTGQGTSTGTVKGKQVGSESSTQPVSAGVCSSPMSSASYEKMKESIASKPFSDTKMSTAKVATKNACLSVAQIRGICSLFSMDDDKLSYAKFAYDYCVEKNNYYQVGDVFSFSATTEELNQFLETR